MANNSVYGYFCFLAFVGLFVCFSLLRVLYTCTGWSLTVTLEMGVVTIFIVISIL